MISSSQRPLPDNTRHSQQTNIHVPGGIQTRDLSRWEAANLRLRPRSHRDWQGDIILNAFLYVKTQVLENETLFLLPIYELCISVDSAHDYGELKAVVEVWFSLVEKHALTGTLWLPLLKFVHAFSSVVGQMPGYNLQRQRTARTLPKLIVVFCVLFVCRCVLYYCHQVSTQLQLTNISISILLELLHNFVCCG